jgi:DNA-binding transcriptional regulator YiaG
MKDKRIITPTSEELQALYDLPSDPDPDPEPGQSAGPQCETLADPEAWVRDFLSDLESLQIDTIDTLTGRPLNEGQREWAIAEKQRQMLTAALPAAIRALRKKLGKAQWEMHFKLGGHSSVYPNWERGRTVPSGVALLMLLRLCPDAETLANFGLAFPSMR